MRRLLSLLGAGAACTLALAPTASASAAVVPDRVIVGFTDSATQAQRAAVRQSVGASASQGIGDPDAQVLTVSGANDTTLAQLRAQPNVQYAEPVYRDAGQFDPPESGYPAQWPLFNRGLNGGVFDDDLDMEQAWELTGPGAPAVLVGYADSSLTLQPEFSTMRVWSNPGPVESPSSGDANNDGCVGDAHGCDAVTKGAKPYDENGHGTATAAIVFADWSAGGSYAGIAPSATFLPAKVLDASGQGTTAQLAAGLRFLAKNGARVVNVSVGGPYSEAVHQAIADNPSTLFVTSAGNAGVNVDSAPSYPCEDVSPNVICVAATNNRDQLASFSNYGASGVDVAAPGQGVPSLALNGSTGVYNGTSFAAPMVTGTAALAFSAKPGATGAEVKAAILGGVDGAPSLTGTTASGGRVNAYTSIAHLLGLPVAPRPAVATVTANGTTAAAGAPGTAATTGDFSDDEARSTTTVIASTMVVRATARRKGAKRIAVRVTCLSPTGCSSPVTIAGGGGNLTTKLGLERYAARTVSLRVRKASVKTVTVTSRSGKIVTTLSVQVR